jgi:hypothetical protein
MWRGWSSQLWWSGSERETVKVKPSLSGIELNAVHLSSLLRKCWKCLHKSEDLWRRSPGCD